MEEFDNITEIVDECALLGAPYVMKSYVLNLQNHIRRIKTNYDSLDFNGESFIADIALAKEQCGNIIEAAELCRDTLEKFHKELTAK